MVDKKEIPNFQQSSDYSHPEGKKNFSFNRAYKSGNASNTNNLSEKTVNKLNELFREELNEDNC